nr:MAG TPA: hypothetical protein [Caudoviricetes sp.]
MFSPELINLYITKLSNYVLAFICIVLGSFVGDFLRLGKQNKTTNFKQKISITKLLVLSITATFFVIAIVEVLKNYKNIAIKFELYVFLLFMAGMHSTTIVGFLINDALLFGIFKSFLEIFLRSRKIDTDALNRLDEKALNDNRIDIHESNTDKEIDDHNNTEETTA